MSRSILDSIRPPFILGVTCALLVIPCQGQGKAVIIELGKNHLIVDYYPGIFKPLMVRHNGVASWYFEEAELVHSPGDNVFALPKESFLIGIPPNGTPKLKVISFESTTEEGIVVAGMPLIKISEDRVPKLSRIFSATSLRKDESDPEILVKIRKMFWLRYQRVASIEVTPFQYDEVAQALTKYQSIRIRIDFPEYSYSLSPPGDPFFESEYWSALVNYRQSVDWRAIRSVPGVDSEPTSDSTSSWFSPGMDYARISLADDGIYTMPYEDLQAISPPLANTQNIVIFYKGKSIPFLIRGDVDGVFGSGDTIEFHGSKLRDDPTTANEYSDTSVYWISFSGSGGKRTDVDSSFAPSPDVILSHFIQTTHVERDSFYYYGDLGLPTNNQSEKVSGEGWYWRRLLANQSTNVGIACSNLYVTGSPTFTLRGKLHSPVVPQSTPNHSVQVSVNGTVIGTIQFAGYSDTVFALIASSSLLVNGMNSIRLLSNQTGASINEIFIDWLELEYKKSLIADSDSLIFVASEASEGQVMRAQVSGFGSPEVEVFRVGPDDGIEKKFLATVSGSVGNYSVTFTDTVQPMRKYILLKAQGKKKPSRVEKKTFGDLRSAAHGADYLIVTGRELQTEANRLAQYRMQQGIGRTKIVLVEDIYDEFNFGHFDPDALRRFLLSADSIWVQPRPAYVVFFGDASWDYKDNLKGGRQNIVPSLGNPLSDTWLVSARDDRFQQTKKVGRIPVSTQEQAAAFIDMLIAYEAEPLTLLNKRYMFMASGFDSLETLRFQQFSDQFISQYVAPAPISGVGVRLYKTVEQVIGVEQTEEAKKLISEGAVWINFYGHAGTDIWGNGITAADQLQNNEQKRHLVSDISCSTARFGEPLTDAFGEKLLLADGGGAVAFMGSTGFGYEVPLRFLANQMYAAVSLDTLREVGAIHFKAKSALHETGTSSLLTRFALQHFTLLGDPATRLAIARQPDYSVSSADAFITPAQPSESDPQITVSIPVSNFGLKGKDSLKVRFVHSTQEGPQTFIETLIPPIGYTDTVRVSDIAFRKTGAHRLQCIVDPDGAVNEVTKSNNSVEIIFFVGSVQSQPIKPNPSASLHTDSVVLVIQNPNLAQTASYRAIFEIDTVPSFTSQAKINRQDIQQGTVITQWSVPSSLLTDKKLYRWRARFASGSDSTSWVQSYFTTDNSFPVQWQQNRTELFAKNQRTRLSIEALVTLLFQRVPVEVFSGGFSDGNEVIIYVNGDNISQGFSGRGYNIAVLDENTGELGSFAAFSIYSDFPDTMLAEPLIQFLSNIPAGETVLVGVADEGAVNKTERLNVALESIGSGLIRSLGFRASWAIIGRKGAPPGSVPELLRQSGSGPVTLRDTLSFQNKNGEMVSEKIGIASLWKAIGFDADTLNGITHISLRVIRHKNDGTQDTVSNIPTDPDSLTTLLPSSVTGIQLIASLSSDSTGLTPYLRKWLVDFQPASDLAMNYQTSQVSADSVLEGNSVDVTATVFNIGDTEADSVEFLFGSIESNSIVPVSQAVLPKLAPGASATVTASYLTSGKGGTNVAFLQVDPLDKITEGRKSNNAFTIPFRVLEDNERPTFDFTFDGTRVFDGDYVSPNPTITVSVFDNSPLPMTSPSDIIVDLDGRRITLGSSPDSLFETRSGPEKAVAIVRPTLSKGEHVLSVQVRDATGNFADTSARQVRFRVETESKLLNVFNYPNPFAGETNFTFIISGARIPEELLIKVYTVAGRLIQEIRVPQAELRIGFNRIFWDGRDREGDELANGVYFYKIVMVAGDKTEEAIQKLAKMR